MSKQQYRKRVTEFFTAREKSHLSVCLCLSVFAVGGVTFESLDLDTSF